MTKEDLQVIIQFMQRVNLNAQEIPAFNKVIGELQKELLMKEKISDSEEGC
jgi:hypothetical protein